MGRSIRRRAVFLGGLAGACTILIVAIPWANAASLEVDPGGYVLERVVMVQRHGVRSPTQDSETLRRLTDRPWPAWPVAPGELTAHGAEGVRLMGAGLAAVLKAERLLPAKACPAPGSVVIVADGHDQRTRASGAALAETLAPGCGLRPLSGAPGVVDPLFDGSGLSPPNPETARAAMAAEAGAAGVDTPETRKALDVLQAVTAPRGCQGEGGVCLSGPSRVTASASGGKIQGPLADGAILAEIFLLEYAQGFPLADVAWGASAEADFLPSIMAAHARAARLTRQTPYLAARHGAPLAKAILAALDAEGSPARAPNFTIFVGHDTNLSNMAGLFGLDWSLPGEPDPTAPSVTLAFELWRNPASGERRVRPVVYYQTLQALRSLAPGPGPVSRLALTFAGCADAEGCPLSVIAGVVHGRLDAIGVNGAPVQSADHTPPS
jgi:4-phytase/acid phosphatase